MDILSGNNDNMDFNFPNKIIKLGLKSYYMHYFECSIYVTAKMKL